MDAYDQLDDQPYVRRGWATLAAYLNLSALRTLVNQALSEERFEDYSLQEFDEQLDDAAALPDESESDEAFSSFRDACSELEQHLPEE